MPDVRQEFPGTRSRPMQRVVHDPFPPQAVQARRLRRVAEDA